jgi:hypothetical protein
MKSFALHKYTSYLVLSVIVLSVIVLSVVLSVIVVSAIALSVIVLGVIVLSDVLMMSFCRMSWRHFYKVTVTKKASFETSAPATAAEPSPRSCQRVRASRPPPPELLDGDPEAVAGLAALLVQERLELELQLDSDLEDVEGPTL